MIEKIIEVLFDKNEKKIAKRRMTVIKNNRLNVNNKKTQTYDNSLSLYFTNNKGLNTIERNNGLRVAYYL